MMSADGVGHRIRLVFLAHRIRRGERQAGLSLQRGHDQLAAAGRPDRLLASASS
jgi:hypothetical protein